MTKPGQIKGKWRNHSERLFMKRTQAGCRKVLVNQVLVESITEKEVADALGKMKNCLAVGLERI